MSALATIVGSLGELSESELRQLYLMVGVRLGIPDVPSQRSAKGGSAGKTGKAKPKGGKAPPSKSASKGNPQRKSQWANHPLYQEYSRLKKVVESQAKEAKTSFNSVDTAERRAYNAAFIQWMEAKSSFRGRSDQAEDHQNGEEDDDEDSSEEEEEAKPSSSTGTGKTGPPPKPISGGGGSKTSPPPAGNTAGAQGSQRGSPTGKGKAATK